jgi:uncharacterized protein with GYD domain
MPRFLIIGRYAAEGARGLMSAGGSARRTAVGNAVAGLGGRIETFDFAFGEDDVYTIVDMPTTESITALALTVAGTGAVQVRTVVLVTPEQLDRAAELRPDYAAPGQTG